MSPSFSLSLFISFSFYYIFNATFELFILKLFFQKCSFFNLFEGKSIINIPIILYDLIYAQVFAYGLAPYFLSKTPYSPEYKKLYPNSENKIQNNNNNTNYNQN